MLGRNIAQVGWWIARVDCAGAVGYASRAKGRLISGALAAPRSVDPPREYEFVLLARSDGEGIISQVDTDKWGRP